MQGSERWEGEGEWSQVSTEKLPSGFCAKQTDRQTDKEMNEREGIVVYLNADMQTNEVKILEVLVLLQQKRQ